MVGIMGKGEQQTARVKLTITSQEKKDRIIKTMIWFEDRKHRVDNFVKISPDTFCSTCCHWRHIPLQCPDPDRPGCQLRAEPYTTRNLKGEICGSSAKAERGC